MCGIVGISHHKEASKMAFLGLYALQHRGEEAAGIVSYDGDNAAQFSYQIRADVDLFDGTGGNPDLGMRLEKDQKAKSRWQLKTGGSVYAIGIGGGLTGRPLDGVRVR